ncbi:hypothetical protein PseBG33_2634 [Pseudomonas synxantha BG33R]|nr:hypothetical protein PseBG33_2634 [Pseudomonas synxantha BG33R]
MRERKTARLLVINLAQQVLLFRFVHKDGTLAGQDYWATPGGGFKAVTGASGCIDPSTTTCLP